MITFVINVLLLFLGEGNLFVGVFILCHSMTCREFLMNTGGKEMFGHNNGQGLFSKGGSGGLLGANPMSPRLLNMVPSEGLSGNGMATIGVDNTFSVIAHLPAPHTLSPYSPAVYAAYLVDGKGKNGFYAGTLRAAGNGVYQANFRSPVPLIHYDKVVISLESPTGIGQAPQGPIVMKVKEGFLDGFGPVKKMGGDMWGKVKGFVGSRFRGKTEIKPEQIPAQQGPIQQAPMQQTPIQQAPIQQYPNQGGYHQAGPTPQVYPQGGYQQGTYQGNRGYQGFQGVQGYQGGQGGGYQYNAYPRGRGMYSPETYRAPVTPAAPVMPNQTPQPIIDTQPQENLTTTAVSENKIE